MNRIVALLLLGMLLLPALPVPQSFTPVYVYGDVNGYAFRQFVTSKTSNYTTISSFDQVPDDARSVVIAPMDRNNTLKKDVTSIASKGALVIILVDDNHSYSPRLDYFDVKLIGYIDQPVNITKLPISARSAGVPYVIASGPLFNATYAKNKVLIPGRYNGTQCNDTAFALYSHEGSGRIVLVSASLMNDTANEKLFEAVYRTLYRIPYPFVKGYDIPSIAVAPPGATFTVYVLNASTFDLEPYYKSKNDISVKIYVYRYANDSQVTTLILNYDSHKKAYFFPATDFGGKRGVFRYNVTVEFTNGTLIYSHIGRLMLASDKGTVVGYMNVSQSFIESLRMHNIVAFPVNETDDLTQYYADALIIGTNITDAQRNVTRKRFEEGNSFIGIAGNRSDKLGVVIGPEESYTNVTATKRLGNVSVTLNSSPYLIVNSAYHVPLVIGDDKELVSMIENPNGGKAIVVASPTLIDPNVNYDLLQALIEKSSEHHWLNVTYKAVYENDSWIFYFYVRDDQGNPINATFVFVSGATYELIAPGEYKVIPTAENFTITFYEPCYGYKTVFISLGGEPENPGTSPGESSRNLSGVTNIAFRTFVAFIILVALISGALYAFKKR